MIQGIEWHGPLSTPEENNMDCSNTISLIIKLWIHESYGTTPDAVWWPTFYSIFMLEKDQADVSYKTKRWNSFQEA